MPERGEAMVRHGSRWGVGAQLIYRQTCTCNPSDSIILLLKYRRGELHLGGAGPGGSLLNGGGGRAWPAALPSIRTAPVEQVADRTGSRYI